MYETGISFRPMNEIQLIDNCVCIGKGTIVLLAD